MLRIMTASCSACGRLFVQRCNDQRYCSRQCGYLHRRKRTWPWHCSYCNRPVHRRPNPPDQRYCSRACKDADHTPLSVRFWRHVQKTDTCWLWTAGCDTHGYGRTRDDDNRDIGAHRASFLLAYGHIPDGLRVLHRCDNPSCVRPDHLFIGTQQDNVRDCIAKGRHSKLTPEQVTQIRQSLASGVSQLALSRAFNVKPTTICDIAHRRSWPDL